MKISDETFRLPKGCLYAPLPIPAYQILGRAKQFSAQRVLIALVSHMGKSSNAVFPSYTTLAKSTGLSRSSISKGLKVLHEYGFIKSVKYPNGIKARVKYFIQMSCFDTGRMNSKANPYKKIEAICKACGKYLSRGEFDFSPIGKVHWGCGGYVEYFNDSKERSRRK